MKYYIATGLEYITEHNKIRNFLNSLGHEITYDWTAHGSVKSEGKGRLQEVAILETVGVIESDFVVVILHRPSEHNLARGTHYELGAAVAIGRDVIIYSSKEEQTLIHDNPCAFYYHPKVKRWVSGFAQLSDAIIDINLLIVAKTLANGEYRNPKTLANGEYRNQLSISPSKPDPFELHITAADTPRSVIITDNAKYSDIES